MDIKLIIVISILLLLVSCAGKEAVAGKAIEYAPDGLLHQWSFDDGTAMDSVGSVNGVIEGAAATANCKSDGCLHFDGVDDYIDFGQFPLPPVFSVVLWLKPDSVGSSAEYVIERIIGQGAYSESGAWYIAMSVPALALTANFYSGYIALDSTLQAPTDQWSHVVLTYDGSQGSFFLNGVVRARKEVPFDVYETKNKPLRLAWNNGGTQEPYFNGLIDELAMYDRVLTDQEVGQLFTQEGVGDVIPPDSGTIEIFVRDIAGNPLSGVQLTIRSLDLLETIASDVTDDEGYVIFSGLTDVQPNGEVNHNLLVEKEGYISYDTDFDFSESTTVVLSPAASSSDAVCGNGVLEGTEGCDDSNMVDNDGCSSLCLVENVATSDSLDVFVDELQGSLQNVRDDLTLSSNEKRIRLVSESGRILKKYLDLLSE